MHPLRLMGNVVEIPGSPRKRGRTRARQNTALRAYAQAISICAVAPKARGGLHARQRARMFSGTRQQHSQAAGNKMACRIPARRLGDCQMELKTAYSLFCDFWHLYKEYWDSGLGEQELQAFADESVSLCHKYGNEKFAREMALAVNNEIERIERIYAARQGV